MVAAESMGSFNSLVVAYRKAKVQSNYTAVTHNLPKGVGSKPGKQKRKAPANVQRPEVDYVINPFPAQDLATSSVPHWKVLSCLHSIL